MITNNMKDERRTVGATGVRKGFGRRKHFNVSVLTVSLLKVA